MATEWIFVVAVFSYACLLGLTEGKIRQPRDKITNDPENCINYEYVNIQPEKTYGVLNGFCCFDYEKGTKGCEKHKVIEPGCEQDDSGKTISCCWTKSHKKMCLYEKQFLNDTCTTALNDCPANRSECINFYTEGEFLCQCKEGYYDVNGDGRNCSLDLCSNPDNIRCNENSVCVNRPGDSYQCNCLPGYVYAPGTYNLSCVLPTTTTTTQTTSPTVTGATSAATTGATSATTTGATSATTTGATSATTTVDTNS